MHEYDIEAMLEHDFRRAGSSGTGYGTVVGAGANATVLHYVENSDALRAGDLVLVDAGAEWEYFSGDITRTFPASGKFTPAQKDLYELVLRANEACVAAVRPKNDIDTIHAQCIRILCEGLHEMGLLEGTVDEAIEKETFKKYYMHRTSHWLGVDVHDASRYFLDKKMRPLAPGYVLTIEPGLYIPPGDESAPEELRGTGIRIEDDILVTADGHENLTISCPKSIADLEALVGSEA
jgi:Xaa-Pro aminopeptidase